MLSPDARCVQISANIEEDIESKARHVAGNLASSELIILRKFCLSAVCAEAAEDANKVPWQAVEEIKHENNECHLYQGIYQAKSLVFSCEVLFFLSWVVGFFFL